MRVYVQKGTILTIEDASVFTEQSAIFASLLKLWVSPRNCPRWFAEFFADDEAASHLIDSISAKLLLSALNPFASSKLIELDPREGMPLWQVKLFSLPARFVDTIRLCFPL